MEECVWRENEGIWETDCGEKFVINDQTPFSKDILFCCFCGKRVVQFLQEVEYDEAMVW